MARRALTFILALSTFAVLDDDATGSDAQVQRVNELFIKRHDEWNRKVPTSNWLKPLEAVQMSTDDVFLKRAYLDTTGRLPTAAEARSFLDDKTEGKRAALVDRLLDSPEWGERWFQRLASLLRLVDEVNGASQKPYVDWVRNAARANMPMDQLVQTLLSAQGSLASDPATGYMLRDAGWLTDTMIFTGQAFLGVSLECTSCHDHPFADWTQMQFYRLCACVGSARVTRGPPASPAGQTAQKTKPTKTLFSGAKPLSDRTFSERFQPNTPPEVLSNELWPADDKQHLKLRSLLHVGGQALEIHDGYQCGIRLPADYKYRGGIGGEVVRPGVLDLSVKRPPIGQQRMVSDALEVPRDSIHPTVRSRWAAWLVSQPRFGQRLAQWMVKALFRDGVDMRAMGAEPGSDGDVVWMGMNRGCCDAADGIGSQRELDEEPVYDGLGTIVSSLRFDMKEFQRVLMKSIPYQAASQSAQMGEPFHYAGPQLRRMSPDAVWDALIAFGGGEDEKSGLLYSKHAPQRLPSDHGLRLLGRGERLLVMDDRLSVSFGLCRWMLTSPVVQRAADHLAKTVKDADELFLTVLSRPPTKDEQRICAAHLAKPGNTLAPVAAALLSGPDFLFVR